MIPKKMLDLDHVESFVSTVIVKISMCWEMSERVKPHQLLNLPVAGAGAGTQTVV